VSEFVSELRDTKLPPPFLLSPPHHNYEQRSIYFCILSMMTDLSMPRLMILFSYILFYYSH